MNRLKILIRTEKGKYILACLVSTLFTCISVLLRASIEECIRAFLLTFLLSLSSFCDISSRTVDNIYPCSVFFLSFAFLRTIQLPDLLIGAAFGLCITLIPALIMKSGMVGGADIKMCAALGAFMGPFPFSMALLFSMPFAIIYGIKNKNKSIPLIPFLSIGTLLSLTIQRIIL